MQNYRKMKQLVQKLLNRVGEGIKKYLVAFGCAVKRYMLRGDNVET